MIRQPTIICWRRPPTLVTFDSDPIGNEHNPRQGGGRSISTSRCTRAQRTGEKAVLIQETQGR